MDTGGMKNFLRELGYGPALESDKDARAWLKKWTHSGDVLPRFPHFINNEWMLSSGKRHFPTFDPSNGEVLAYLAVGESNDVEKAVRAAENAFPSWSSLPGFERQKKLYAIARTIEKYARFFAVLESIDNGKPIRETRDIDIPAVARHFRYHAGWAVQCEEEYPNHAPGGVIAQIIPWNFPLLMLAWKIAPAIAVGNTVVLKPAETTSLTALFFAELLKEEVKLPPGVVNIVTGEGGTGELLVNHPTPWKIAFTGSTEH